MRLTVAIGYVILHEKGPGWTEQREKKHRDIGDRVQREGEREKEREKEKGKTYGYFYMKRYVYRFARSVVFDKSSRFSSFRRNVP